MKPKSTLYVLIVLLLAAAMSVGCVRYASAAPAGQTFTASVTVDATGKAPDDSVCEPSAAIGVCGLSALVVEANAYIGANEASSQPTA